MSSRLGEVQARLNTVTELASVVTVMRSIAAARTREALERLPGIRACADQIGAAIASAMTLALPSPAAMPSTSTAGGRLQIAIGAEQGFVGTFNHRVLEAARATGGEATEYFVIGNRSRLLAREWDMPMTWTAEMVAHAEAVPDLAGKIVGALYRRLSRANVSRVTLVHGVPEPVSGAGIVATSLLPFDFKRFGPAARAFPPLVTLPVPTLQERLAEEYVYTQVCEALTLSFAAENEARMRAMLAARRNIDETVSRLTTDYQRLRQEQITAEIIELSTFVIDRTRSRRAADEAGVPIRSEEPDERT